MKAEGYIFSRENCPTFSFEVNPIANDCDEPKGKVKIELKMDAYNSKSKWAIQFVSSNDYDKFKNDECMSSVSNYNSKGAAEIINQELQKQNKTNAVVFYDPMRKVKQKEKKEPKDWEKYLANEEYLANKKKNRIETTSKDEAKELLLAQVEDFIKWLKINNIKIK